MTRENNYAFKFGTLVVCLLFYFLKELLGRKSVVWDKSRLVAHKILDYMQNLGNLQEHDDALTAFFIVFQKNMHERERIP